ncbi:9186_t:CDS:2, partial [Gigaspora margarita]
IRLGIQQHNFPVGQFTIFATNAQLLRVEEDAKTHLYTNALFSVKVLLPQGLFGATPAGFLEETTSITLYVFCIVQPTDTNPTLRKCIYCISQLAINDNVGNRLGRGIFDNVLSNDNDNGSSYHDSDDYDGPNYDPDDSDSDNHIGLRKRKRKSKSDSKTIASLSKRIITIDDYIGGGSFRKVFSRCYDNHDVA